MGSGAFVGRARELAVLREALMSAQRGDGGLVLLAGEPGIGKTRLAEHLAREAEAGGACVLSGRCHDGDGAPAYWPWSMALRDLASHVDPRAVRAWLGTNVSVLGQIVPELATGTDGSPAAPELDGEAARFRLFDVVATVLRHASAVRPLLVLLDDVHWADAGSLRLLHFATRQLARARVLFVVTLRRAEMDRRADADLRDALARAGCRLDLTGLAAGDVDTLVRAILGREPPEGLAARVHAASAGNPFFVDALLRVVAAEGPGASSAPLRIPDGVRDVVRARLRPLAPEAKEVLAVAALLGQDFAAPLLARVAGTTLEVVIAALDKAEALDVVGPAGDGSRHRFVHTLFAETLAADLPARDRAVLHGRIAAHLEPLVESGAVPLDEVAAHWFEAVPAGSAEQAVAWAIRAAERARVRLGHEDEARYYRRAVDVLDASGLAGPARRVDLLLRLGDAERRVGQGEATRATFHRAAALAAEHGLAEPLARAALGYGAGFGGLWDQGGGFLDGERVRLVDDALAAVGPQPSGLRALLLAHLAASLFWSTTPERRALVDPLGRAAVAMAEERAEPDAALAVLASAHWTSWGPDDAEGRLRRAEEIVERALALRQPEIVLRGRMYAAAHHLELADVVAADREIDRFEELAMELRQRRQLWYPNVYRAMRAHMSGDFAEMERLTTEGMTLGETAHPLPARLAFGAQLTLLRREQGRVAETLAGLREMVTAAPGMPVWRCALASGLVDAGALDEARAELERLAAGDFERLPRDFLWLYATTHAARACAALGDEARAAVLYEGLRPYAGRVSLAQHGVLCDGAVDRYLGLLATTLARWDDAGRHFEDALVLNRRIGAASFVTATQHDQACMLLRRGAADHVRRASALLDAAADAARRIGQAGLLAKIEQTRSALGAPVAREAARVEDVCELRRRGSDWMVSHAGRTFLLRHVIGVDYLLALLCHPGREFHALDLIARGDPSSQPRAGGDAGEVLDEQARRTYRQRLGDLRGELEEAQAHNDLGRAERAQAEIDALTAELARAVGLGGRARRAGSDAERARLNVTRAVRRVIDAVAEQDGALGSDLRRGVRTGFFCSYEPDPRFPIRWDLETTPG